MSKISSYSVNNSPDTQFLLLGTDPENHSMASTGTTEVVPISAFPFAVTQVYNVVALYGADPTGTTECHTAIGNAITAAAADPSGSGVVYIPNGTYLISGGWTVPANVIITGAGSTGGSVTTDYTGTVLKLSSSFSGSYVFGYAESSGNPGNAGPISNLLIIGSAYTAAAVDGIRVTGPAMCVIQNIQISQMSGWGINTVLVSGNEIGAFGQDWQHILIDSCVTGGAQLLYAEDSSFNDVYIIGCGGPNWVITGCDNSKFVNCRAEWSSGSYGFWVTNAGGADWTYASGWTQFIGCSTDRNNFSGFRIDGTWATGGGSTTGPGAILISNLVTRRDGGANNDASGSYAGLDVDYSGASGANKGLPVFVNGIGQMTGQIDGGTGNMSPRYGLRVNTPGTAPVQVANGMLWGYDAAINGSTSATFTVSNIVQQTGNQYSYTA